MFEIILMCYLSFRNNILARRKGLNGMAWAALTAVAFLATLFLGVMVVVFGFCADKVNTSMMGSPDPKVRAVVTQQLLQLFNENPLHLVTVEFFAFGGYLLIRYLLERKPEPKQPEQPEQPEVIG